MCPSSGGMATPSNSSSSAPSGAGSGGNNLHSSQGNDRSTSPHHQITDTLSTTSVIVKEGWLRKKGSRANLWSERYFVLRGPSLFYFIKSDNVVCIFLLLSSFATSHGFIGTQRSIFASTSL